MPALPPPIYNFDFVDPLWLGGDGFLAGLPVTRAVFSRKPGGGSTPLDLFQVVKLIKDAITSCKASPRYIVIAGDEGAVDNVFLHGIHHHLQTLVYVEISGTKPLTDRNHDTPVYDHICLRLPEIPDRLSNGILFHSVVVGPKPDPAKLIAFSAYLDREGIRAQRFIATEFDDSATNQDAKLVASVSRLWRLTHPIHGRAV